MRQTQTETKITTEQTLNKAVEAVQEKKGFDITILDLRELPNAAASYFLICCGNSDRQNQAIADEVKDMLKKQLDETPLHIEGHFKGEWILLDYFDLIVHVMLPRMREFYDVEELWGDAKTTRVENLD